LKLIIITGVMMNVLSTFAAVTHNGGVFVVSKGETADY
jgi:hypothetical protein